MATRTIGDPKARLTTILIAPLMSCSARLPVYVLIIGVFIEPVYGAFWAGFALFAMHFLGLAVAIPVAWLLNRFVLRTPSQPFILEMPPYRAPRLRDVLLRMWLRGYDFIKTAGTVIFAMTVIIWALLYFPGPRRSRNRHAGSLWPM
jgi:ferrous iron transport protein B